MRYDKQARKLVKRCLKEHGIMPCSNLPKGRYQRALIKMKRLAAQKIAGDGGTARCGLCKTCGARCCKFFVIDKEFALTRGTAVEREFAQNMAVAVPGHEGYTCRALTADNKCGLPEDRRPYCCRAFVCANRKDREHCDYGKRDDLTAAVDAVRAELQPLVN